MAPNNSETRSRIFVPKNFGKSILDKRPDLRDKLSETEQGVMALILEGYSTKEAARMIFRSHYTVKDHRKNSYKKLGVNGVIEMFILFLTEPSDAGTATKSASGDPV